MVESRDLKHWDQIIIITFTLASLTCLKYRDTKHASKEHTKSYGQSTTVKMKNDTNNTLTGCISLEPRQMFIIKQIKQ